MWYCRLVMVRGYVAGRVVADACVWLPLLAWWRSWCVCCDSFEHPGLFLCLNKTKLLSCSLGARLAAWLVEHTMWVCMGWLPTGHQASAYLGHPKSPWAYVQHKWQATLPHPSSSSSR
jgi:hypothetical protein